MGGFSAVQLYVVFHVSISLSKSDNSLASHSTTEKMKNKVILARGKPYKNATRLPKEKSYTERGLQIIIDLVRECTNQPFLKESNMFLLRDETW